jgi:hypothetical protein
VRATVRTEGFVRVLQFSDDDSSHEHAQSSLLKQIASVEEHLLSVNHELRLYQNRGFLIDNAGLHQFSAPDDTGIMVASNSLHNDGTLNGDGPSSSHVGVASPHMSQIPLPHQQHSTSDEPARISRGASSTAQQCIDFEKTAQVRCKA